jgi:hypothetical protein
MQPALGAGVTSCACCGVNEATQALDLRPFGKRLGVKFAKNEPFCDACQESLVEGAELADLAKVVAQRRNGDVAPGSIRDKLARARGLLYAVLDEKHGGDPIEPFEVLSLLDETADSYPSSVAHTFTNATIAEAAGVTIQTVGHAMKDGKVRPGEQTPDDLRSLATYVTHALALKGRVLGEERVLELLPEQQRGWWKKRWPTFDLFACQFPGCAELMFSSGLCSEHGGDRKPAIAFGADWQILLLLDGDTYVPLARLVSQTSGGLHTHHRDGNSWNNRWENIEALSQPEHEKRHRGGLLTAPVMTKQPPRQPLRSEAGGLTRAELQRKIDQAYARGVADGRRRVG